MTDAYVYRAALYCASCIEGTVGVPSDDSDMWPQGPYADGGGEADYPQHCDECGVFLENPLTDDGREYVELAIAGFDHDASGNADVINEWREFYEVEA